MADIKEEIEARYQYLVNKKLSSRVVNYWALQISKSLKTFQDFETFVLTSDDYRRATLDKFRDTYCSLVDLNFNPSTFDLFWTSHIKKDEDNDTETCEVTYAIIDAYIRESPEFEARYSDIISKMFEAIYKSTPNAATIASHIHKFKYTVGYTLEMMQTDIENQEIEIGNTLNTDNSIKDPNAFVDEQSVCNVCSVSHEALIPSATHANTQHKLTNQYNVSMISTFEDIFERPMFVQEYFKWDEVMLHNKKGDFTSIISDAHIEFIDAWTKVHILTSSYLDEATSEYTFVKTYLSAMDSSTFIQDLQKTIIHSDEYKTKMDSQLKHLYKSTYGENLGEHDLAFIFDKVKQLGLGLRSEKLSDVLIEFKNLNDKIIQNIITSFQKVVRRSPDDLEFDKYTAYYLDRHGKEGISLNDEVELMRVVYDVNHVIEKELIQSLEFHDIVKQRIRFLDSDLPTSKVFGVLAKVLANIMDVTMDNLDATITQIQV